MPSSPSFLLASVLLLSLANGGTVEAAKGVAGGRKGHGGAMRRQGGGAGGAHGHGGVEKRQASNAAFTWYYTHVGNGACGATHQDDEYTVAMNSAQFSGGSVCGQYIQISYNGKTASALVADECPTCPYGGLDLSPGLFTHFASTDDGEIYGSWSYGSTPETTTTAETTTTTAAAPTTTKTTTTKAAEPTTTSTTQWIAPTTTSTAPTSSISSTPSSSAAPSTSSTAFSSNPASSQPSSASSAAPVASATAATGSTNVAPEGLSVLLDLGRAVNALGSVVCLGSEGCVV